MAFFCLSAQRLFCNKTCMDNDIAQQQHNNTTTHSTIMHQESSFAIMTNPQRRKIFPHLEESKKATTKQTKERDDTYDNAKTTKAAKAKQHPSVRKQNGTAYGNTGNNNKNQSGSSASHHLVPLPLAFTVLLCSGLFWISSFRDMMATGKPILDTLGFLWGQVDADANFLVSLNFVNVRW